MRFTRSLASFAAGASAVAAVTFGGLTPWPAAAAPGDTDTTFVPVEPCRLLDTRPAGTQGDRRAPLGAGEIYTASLHGTNGDCVGLPRAASAVSMNVTALNPTTRSFLTIFPADVATLPQVSSLNWIAGQPPTPNKVDVKLAPNGTIKLYNDRGTVNVVVDVVGYYTPSSLTEIDSRLAALEASRSDAEPRLLALETNKPFVVRSAPTFSVAVSSTGGGSIRSVVVDAPTAGTVTLFASGTAVEDTAGWNIACEIDTDVSVANFGGNDVVEWEASGTLEGNADGEGDASVISFTRTFDLAAGTSTTFHFTCRNRDGAGATIAAPALVALFTPA